jgi:hypothetical protein
VLGTVGGYSVIFMVKISVPVVSWVEGEGSISLQVQLNFPYCDRQQLHDCVCALRDKSTSKDGETQVCRDLTQHFFTPAQFLVTAHFRNKKRHMCLYPLTLSGFETMDSNPVKFLCATNGIPRNSRWSAHAQT